MNDLKSFHDVLADYYGIIVPDEWLQNLVNDDEKLLDELHHNSISDTCARGYLIDVICQRIGVRVDIPNMFGDIGTHHYPCFGDSKEYKTEFIKSFDEKLFKIGGSFVKD